MSSEDRGPYYVVLGGKKAGIYEQSRPSNTALGAAKALVPIVVICSNREDAEAIFTLQEKIFKITLPDDAHTMVYLLQRPPATTLDLEVKNPIYAVRVGRETGVYIGYEWRDVWRFIEGGKGIKPAFEGCQTVAEALIAMLKKPGANLPLLPAGAAYPAPPPRPTRQLRFDLPPSAEQEQETAPPTASSATSPTTSAAPPPVRSPTLSTAPRSPSPVKRTAASTPSMDTATNMQELSAAFREILRADPMEPLRRLLRPPPSMGGPVNPRLPAVVFGPEADDILVRSGAGPGELLTLLQVRVHARTVESFTHHIGLMLGWTTRDAARMWEIIRLPEF
ncbi:hypothetical protein OH76DRAFT_1483953 [Lentinus brumalis]|uniref:Uncharacterized protein n=1 Tax=Lentinus brumalis TaxID=2498619 RepID=A0A371D719_9APHY|nr:hypothetical protein OH76DRAFT_1483953 [Polyporus brumalis]